MIPWKEIDRANVPGQTSDIILSSRGSEFSIRIAGTELMNSRIHGSEDALAKLTCQCIQKKSSLKVLIGGLGMGYTLSAALEHLQSDTRIIVSELVPAVVRWNREYLGHLSGMPLDDPRVTVEQDDVANIIRQKETFWDAILLDVDNGPEGLTRKANDCLYSRSGLKKTFRALRPHGILSVWSCGADDGFTRRLNQCGFRTKTLNVCARKPGKGGRHVIWIAEKC